MSGWIQNFAEKAETMLVKLDQNAKVLITEEKEKLVPSSSSSTQPDIRIENEVAKPIKSTRSKSSSLQLTPKKAASYSSNLSNLGTGSSGSKDVKDTGKNSTTSSRRSSITQEGSVIENFTEAAMQTSIEVKTESAAQVRLAEMEEICNSLVAEKEYLVERNQLLEEENGKNIKIISELEATISRHHRNELELNEKLDWAKKETDQAIIELQQYRTRAQQTLQMKENIIKQLKDGKQVDGESETDVTALRFDLQQLQIDKKHLQEELHNYTDKYEQIKVHTAKLEQRLEENNQREQKLRELQDSLQEAALKCSQLEEDLKAKVDEVVSVREDSLKQRAGLLSKLSDKEGEILSLRAKLSQRQQNLLTSDAEERIHSLTHSLVQKQAALESITAERNGLRIQLEKLDALQRTAPMEPRYQRPLRMDVNETDDVKARIPLFLQESPFDTRFSRRVKRAYSTLDSAGVRVGAFLRRYPLARIMVLFYIALLHLWVMFVLLSSTPKATPINSHAEPHV